MLSRTKTQQKNDVFVGNIPYGTTEQQLHSIFSEAGKVVNIRSVVDHETGKPKGYAFVEFEDSATALSAIRNLNGFECNGRQLRVNYSSNSSLTGEKGTGVVGGIHITAEHTVKTVVDSMTLNDIHDIITQMKDLAHKDPPTARKLFTSHPQIAEAILQMQLRLGMIKPGQIEMHAPMQAAYPIQLIQHPVTLPQTITPTLRLPPVVPLSISKTLPPPPVLLPVPGLVPPPRPPPFIPPHVLMPPPGPPVPAPQFPGHYPAMPSESTAMNPPSVHPPPPPVYPPMNEDQYYQQTPQKKPPPAPSSPPQEQYWNVPPVPSVPTPGSESFDSYERYENEPKRVRTTPPAYQSTTTQQTSTFQDNVQHSNFQSDTRISDYDYSTDQYRGSTYQTNQSHETNFQTNYPRGRGGSRGRSGRGGSRGGRYGYQGQGNYPRNNGYPPMQQERDDYFMGPPGQYQYNGGQYDHKDYDRQSHNYPRGPMNNQYQYNHNDSY